MASFWQNLMQKLGRRSADAPALHLAAFGKHPGWDDHIADIGLETDELAWAKRVLYVQGIGGNTDSGAWEKLTADQRVEGFAHALLWRLGPSTLAGRIWASRDGKGRGRYPMVVLTEGTNLPPEWMAREALPQLEQVERQCAAMTSAADVGHILEDARRQMRERAAAAAPRESASRPGEVLAQLAAHPAMGPDRHGLHAVLYQVQNELSAYLPRKRGDGGTRSSWGRAAHLRVPALCDDIADSLWLWQQFLRGQLDPAAPALAVGPVGKPWVDLIVGEPQAGEFYCLLAGQGVIPLTTEIPYNLDASFVQRAEDKIAAARTP